jgi:cellulase (glycosyl hydrolase family 5)
MQRLLAIALLTCWVASGLQAQRWSESKANQWYSDQGWLVGCNYNPASAINQLEMWQAASFDPERIDLELGWAAKLGMNTLRVYLHDLLWQQDAEGLRERIDTFLDIAAKHGIRPMFVLFDSCWDPNPALGPQRAPKPGVHNSGWVQSPGAEALQDPAQHPRLERYVKGLIGAFAGDERVLAWDIWNEPSNTNGSSYGKQEPENKADLVLALLPKAMTWARAAAPTQPLTCGVWQGDWSDAGKLSAIQRIQLDNSDVISFHNYENGTEFAKRVEWLQRYNRPLLCTEFMARGNGSTFQEVMPVAKRHRIALYNWGFVAGKTQTQLPWDSWQKPYVDREPTIWFHEIFHRDGTPYRQQEVDFIRKMTGE